MRHKPNVVRIYSKYATMRHDRGISFYVYAQWLEALLCTMIGRTFINGNETSYRCSKKIARLFFTFSGTLLKTSVFTIGETISFCDIWAKLALGSNRFDGPRNSIWRTILSHPAPTIYASQFLSFQAHVQPELQWHFS